MPDQLCWGIALLLKEKFLAQMIQRTTPTNRRSTSGAPVENGTGEFTNFVAVDTETIDPDNSPINLGHNTFYSHGQQKGHFYSTI